MAAELDLTSLAAVRAWLGFNAANTEHDGALERMISGCSTTMQRLMGRTIAVTDYKHNQNGNGSDFMVLRNAPIVRVQSIVVDDVPLMAGSWDCDETTVYLRGSQRFAKGRNNIALRYQAGFDTIPADLEQACVETVGLRWQERARIGMTSKGLAGETTSFSLADFSPSVRTVLSTYQRTASV